MNTPGLLNSLVGQTGTELATTQAGQVLKKRMHTITDLSIYPNGQVYVSSTKSWFDQAYIPKKQESKKTVEAKQTKVEATEEY